MISRTQVHMGTFITISLPSEHKKHIDSSFKIIKDVDAALSSYKKNATIYKLNENKKTNLDELSFEALELSMLYYQKTNGYFNIAIGSITKDLYHFGEDERVPSRSELQNANTNFKGLEFNTSTASIEQGVKIDLGGMGKGFGVDKVTEYLMSKGVKKGVVAASGDIRCLDTCPITVQNPFSEDILASFNTKHKNSSISTSGNYNRYVNSPIISTLNYYLSKLSSSDSLRFIHGFNIPDNLKFFPLL